MRVCGASSTNRYSGFRSAPKSASENSKFAAEEEFSSLLLDRTGNRNLVVSVALHLKTVRRGGEK